MPSETPPMCSDGTILDPASNSCVIDPESCQNGTVLIGGKCVDPTEGLEIDLNEGAEPNNLGAGGIEDSGDVAGEIQLKAIGETFVVKGTINPFRDGDGDGEIDPDLDAYAFQVNAPALIEISVDGVNGLMGAYFMLTTSDSPAAGWFRYGINITGDTSKRQIWLPAAGTYVISVGDTRSMYIDADSPPAAGFGGAAGGPDATYFMSLKVLPTPAPTALTLASDGTAIAEGDLAPGDVKFYTAPMGLGVNAIELDVPGTPGAAVILAKNGAFKSEGVESFDIFSGPLPASISALGFKSTDQALIVADTTYHYGPGATPFTLAVGTGDAGELSTTGGSVSQPESDTDFSAFFYDVSADNQLVGFDLAWDQPVSGAVVDEDFFLVANFTYDPAAGFSDLTFISYKGLIRHRTAGRYYFLVFDPNGTGASDLTATSTIAAVAAGTVVKGTPLMNQSPSAYGVNPYSYAAGLTDVWQEFNASGTGTGAIASEFFDPDQAYGRLGALTVHGTDPLVDDTSPVFTQSHPEGGRPHGRVLIGDQVSTYLVLVQTETGDTASTFTLDFKARAFHDYGTLAQGDSVTLTDEMLDTTAPVRYYLLRTAPGNLVSLVTDPVTATLDSRIRVLTADDNVSREFNAPGAGTDDAGDVFQSTSGWTAFSVSSTTPPTGALAYNLTVGASMFTPPTYTQSAGTTAYDDACVGGTAITLVADGSSFPNPQDEGFSETTIPTPSGFQFFGLYEPAFRVSSNGWLSFLDVTTAMYSNPNMPNAAVPNGVIAPYWDDLEDVEVCTKTIGTKLVVQWTGFRYNTAEYVETQAILDGGNDTIEVVWGSNQDPTGASATIGIEDQTGTATSKVGYNTAGTAPAGTSVVFTPN